MTRPLPLLLLGLAFAATVGLTEPSGAQALGSKFTGLQVTGDKPIAVESDQLDVEDAKAIATFSGNVAVSQGEMQLKAAKLIVHYAKAPAPADGKTAPKPAPAAASAAPGASNQIERLEASGKVYVKSADQVATADAADFNMKTQIAILTGNVVLSQGDNVASGDKLTIHMDTGVAQLGGGKRVKVMMAPQQQGAQPGAPKPAKP